MRKAYVFIVLTAFLFGTMEVACKIAGNGLDPFQLTFIRFAIGGLILLPFAIRDLRKNHIVLTAKDFVILAFTGLLGVTISMVLFQIAVVDSNASTVSVLICVNPFFTMIFAHMFTDEKMTKIKGLVLFIAIVGILFMMRPWDIQAGNSAFGMIMMLLSALFFGAYTVVGKVSVKKMGPFAQTSISFIAGSILLLVIILFMGKPVIAGVADNIPIVLYAGIVVTGIGYFCYFKGIELSDASTGSIAFFLKPAIAPVIAVIILGESVMWNTVVGIILILTASFINMTASKKAATLKG